MFQQHPPIVGECCIDLCRSFQIAVERTPQILLAGKVGAIANPDGQIGRANFLPDLDALDIMLDRLLARSLQCRGERTGVVAVRLPGLILKRVRIDRIETKAETFRLLAKRRIVANLVPRKVRANARGHRR